MWFWSWGRWLKVTISLPDDFNVKDIDRSSIRLNGKLSPKKTWIKHYRRGKRSKLIALFKRREVLNLLGEPGQHDLVITGQVNGAPFKGEDKTKLINPWWRKWKKKTKLNSSAFQPSQAAGNADGAIYFYHLDHLGTPLVITNEQGEIVWQADYQPFGKADIQIDTIGNSFRFPGQFYDAETGFHYNYHRYYDPTIGRYLTPDPIGLTGGINLYTYADLDPIKLVDPFGMFNSSRVFWGVAEASAGGLGIGLAVATEYFTVGAGTAAAVGLSAISVPALSHGVTEIIVGALEDKENRIPQIPQASGPALAALVATGNVDKANRADLVANMVLLGGKVGKMAAEVPSHVYLGMLEAVSNFGNVAHKSPMIIEQTSESNCPKKQSH